jgi:polysaccharide chain length determinant protein (PEP-CTERM system associated)
MLPGKKYELGDILRILWRRAWFALLPFAVVSAGAAVLARVLPDTYRASALVAVVPQQVPESIVRPAVTSRLPERLQAIQNQVLSRPRLERLILDLNLYAEERQTGIMDDIVQRMRTRDLRITPQGAVAFLVTYTGPDPVSTKRVVDQIASDFIAESLVDRSRQTDLTNQFIETQLEEARRRLAERDAAVAAYRRAHGHELPSQQQTNLQAMMAANAQAQAAAQVRNTASESRLELERLLATELETPPGASPPPTASLPGRGVALGPAAQELAVRRKDLEAARARWTPAHPDVQRLETLVRDLEGRAQTELLASTGATAGTRSPAEVARDARIADLQKRIAETNAQIARANEDEQRHREQAAEYRARIEAAPVRENEFNDLMRGYGAIQAQFDDLIRKSEATRLQASLERQEIGQSFRLIEPALTPERPFSPDRRQISLLGMAAGLALGLGLVALLEYRDGSFRTDSEVTSVLGLPVLAVVPVMRSEPERRRALAWRFGLNMGLGGTVAVCLAVLAYTFIR